MTPYTYCWFFRCTAPASNLDANPDEQGRRSQEHTEILVKELKLGVLWDEYGLVGDIVVSLLHFFFYLRG